jgi:type II secretory pathway pseudopilin PulG
MTERRTRSSFAGRSLLELLLVIVILGALAGICIAAMGAYSSGARESALRNDIRHLRTQITLYQLQHANRPPEGDRLVELLTSRTTAEGEIDVAGAALGPYLHEFPANPFNRSRTVRSISPDQEFAPDDSEYGWIYQSDGSSFRIAVNTTKRDSSGVLYFSY